jgi:MFS family permease
MKRTITRDESRVGVQSMLSMVGLFITGFLVFGIGVYAFTQFLEPIQFEFGWNRTVIGGLMSAFWFAAPFVLLSSYLLDRVGIRTLVIGGAAIEAVGLAWMTMLSSPSEFFFVRFLMGAGKCLAVTPIPIAVARWFPVRTGFALAIALCGWHVGGLVMAPMAAYLIAAYGWRTAALVLAGLLLGGIAAAAALMRDPSGVSETGPPSGIGVARRPNGPGANPLSMVAIAALVAIGVGTLAFYAGYAGLLSQLSPMLHDAGYSAKEIGDATGSVAICAMFGVLLCGGITQVVAPRNGGALVLLLMGALEFGATALGVGTGTAPLIGLVGLLGLLIGGGDPILVEALRQSVPLTSFRQAYGWWYLLCVASLAAAPVIAGAAYDYNGSYRAVFFGLGGFSIAAAVIWLFMVGMGRPTARAN